MSFQWTCPYCNHKCVIGEENYRETLSVFDLNNKHKNKLGLKSFIIVCPNDECEEVTIKSFLYKSIALEPSWRYDQPDVNNYLNKWNLLPNSHAKPFPDYIPAAILADYNEACIISDLSPKASATLARRCLQGMIRDFWKINDKTLYKEINTLEGSVSKEIWETLNAVREIGNIGAHMEQDINVIIDVDEDEAKILIELLEILFEEWYIAKYERDSKLSRIQQIRDEKKSLKV